VLLADGTLAEVALAREHGGPADKPMPGEARVAVRARDLDVSKGRRVRSRGAEALTSAASSALR
jgi:hypothetical protein